MLFINQYKDIEMGNIKQTRFYFILLIILSLSGCGGSSGQNQSSNNEIELTTDNYTDDNYTIAGKVIDGEISGATLFLDLDRDNELDSNEPKTVTKKDGSFILNITKSHQKHINYKNKTAPLIVFGGVDSRTSAPFKDYLMSMREDKTYINITPFSTLIAQGIFSELEKVKLTKINKASTEDIEDLKAKIEKIKEDLAQLFGIKSSLLDKNPIDLAKEGDNRLLNHSLQLHKSAKAMKKAMKKDVKKFSKSILKSYKALIRELKKIKKEALKEGDNPLLIAVETAMDDEIFDKDLVKEVKEETKSIINQINDFWEGQEGTLSDNALSDAVRNMEERLKRDENQDDDASNDSEENSNQGNSVIGSSNKIFISLQGDNKNGDGSFDKPYADTRVICSDTKIAHPDLTIYYRGGVYQNPDFGNGDKDNSSMPQIRCSGSKGHPVVIRPWKSERVKFQFDSALAVRLSGNYVKFQGFEVEGVAQNITYKEAIANWWIGDRYYNGSGIVSTGHHVEIADNIVHDTPASGISARDGDFITIKNNIVYNCDWWTIAGSKGIGVTDAKSSDGSTTAQNIKIESNLIFNVESRIISRVWKKGKAHLTIDEGEGVLVQINNADYRGRYLIKNNFLLFTGKGIVVNQTNKADLVHNTLYKSGTTIAGNFRGLRGNGTDDTTIEGNAVSVVPDGYAYSMGGGSSNLSIKENCLDGAKRLDIEGLHYTDTIFVNPKELDFHPTDECSKTGASIKVWERLKAKADEYGIKIEPTNWKPDYVNLTKEIIEHIPKDAKIDWSTWSDSEPFELEITDIPTGIDGRPSRFSLEVVYPFSQSLLKHKDVIENLTNTYKKRWFNPAKKIWNEENNNSFDFDYFTYKFPKNADFEAGTPPDAPITAKEWMQKAGLGLSKKIDIPSSVDSLYRYDDALVKSWKAKGFRTGRFHIQPSDFLDLEADPTGMTLKKEGLKELKRACQLFVDNDIPTVISFADHSDFGNDMRNNSQKTIKTLIEWWRQIAESLKDMSHLVAFENFVEYHGFDDVPEELKFGVYLDNHEVFAPNFRNYRNRGIDNWVRSPIFNNLMAERAKVIRVTNPTRVLIYKPNGIGRGGMVNITPWRWGSEKCEYVVHSVGGSANMKYQFILAIRESNSTKSQEMLYATRRYTWGPAVNYFNATKLPVWISLWGLRLDERVIDEQLDGIAPTIQERMAYIKWYQEGIQTSALLESGERVRIPSAFQQSWWLWDFRNHQWFDDMAEIREKLSSYTFVTDVKESKHYPPVFLQERINLQDAVANSAYRGSLQKSVAYDKGEIPTFEKVSGASWIEISTQGEISGVPSQDDVGENNLTVKASNSSGETKIELSINVLANQIVTKAPVADSYCQKNKSDKNFGEKKSIAIKDINGIARVGVLKFNLSDISQNISNATLKIYSDSFEGNLTIRALNSTAWEEDDITWDSMPPKSEILSTITAKTKEWVTFDLSSTITQSAEYSFVIESSNPDLGILSSKEGSNPPKLVLTL
jgi:hypothetical protein